ncbi:hypothetical protein DFQ26_009014 [Actinomortierella ambigua]|nr:hypothetical protein DFQ26_009014 [Actinomortierella ambigua]
MGPPQIRVIIAGAGIAGLCLAIFLERAGIDYVVLERGESLKALGSTMTLSAQVLRVFDQLGLLEDLQKIGLPLAGFKYYDKEMNEVGRMEMIVDNGPLESELMEFLLTQVPKDKIHWGKRILSTMQNKEGVMCRCSDSSCYDGDILVGADGAYSAVRQSMQHNMKLKNLHVPESDMAPLRFTEFSILGVTEPLEDLPMPVSEDKQGTFMLTILPKEEGDLFVYVIALEGMRLGWRLAGQFLSAQVQSEENFRFSEWGSDDINVLVKDLSDRTAPIVGTVGKLFDSTKQISRIMLEEKKFDIWYEGRTVLMGDACHKMLPSGGQGANQAIYDAVCLANLLYELPSNSVRDIKKVFARYYALRKPYTDSMIDGSAKFSRLLGATGFFASLVRKIFFHYIPESVRVKRADAMFSARPILNFLGDFPLKGTVPDTSLPMTLKDPVAI